MEEIINLIRFKELNDEEEGLFFENNLIDLFEYLQEHNLLCDKKQKYIFWVSKVFGTENNPYRDVCEKVGTIRMLLNYWKWTFGKPFSIDSLNDIAQSKEFDMEAFQMQARKDSAWGAYGSYVRQQNEIREYQEAEKLPEKERETEIKRLKNRSNYIVIG